MQYVLSKNGFPIGKILDQSYWAIKRRDGSWICEQDLVFDLLRGHRNLDWSLDIITTGDWRKIAELWLICPANHLNPAGQTARLSITTPGTAFQLKVSQVDANIANIARSVKAQLIGRVMDSEGWCECMVYDYALDGLITRWPSNVFAKTFGTWQPGIAPLGPLRLPVLGINLPNSPGEGTVVVVESDPSLLKEASALYGDEYRWAHHKYDG
jgi:hypothetical protein